MLRALAFLELDFFKNNVRAILRKPQRFAIWLPTIVALGLLYGSRSGPPSHGPVTMTDLPRVPHVFDLAADLASSSIGYLFIALASISSALALGGRTTVFRSSAEAVMFSNVGMAPLLVALWLQARKLASSFRLLTGAIYLFVFAPAHTNAATATRSLALALVSFAIPTCIQLPSFLLRRSRAATALQGAMWAVCVLALAGLGALLVSGERARVWLERAHVDPGPAARAIATGRPLGVACVLAVVAALCASIAFLGRDAMPDFYRVTTQNHVERRARPSGDRRIDRRESRWQTPVGPLAYVWKDWVAFRRGRGRLSFWLGTIAFWSVVGTAVSFARSREAPGILAFTCLLFLVGVAPITAGEDLAAELSKPLFWLGRDRVTIRLAAITFGRAARTGIGLGVAPMCAAALQGSAILTLASVPLAVLFAWALQAMGTALFAFFPSDLDQRGPIAYLRFAVGIGFVVPGLVGASLGFLVFGTPGAIAGAMTIAVLEGSLALWFAADCFERRGGAAYGRARIVG